MRGRLLILVLGCLAAMLAAFEVPLAIAYAGQTSLDLFVTQLTDTTRFAALAEPALQDGRRDALAFELRRYDQLYGAAVYVVDPDGKVVVRSRPELDIDPVIQAAVDRALAGQPSERPHVAWPWDARPYVVAEPVGRDNQVTGAVITVAPTDSVRTAVGRRLLVLVAGGLGSLALAAFALGVPLVRWVLRPVARLAAVTQEISGGKLSARVARPSGAPELRRLVSAFNAMADSVQKALDRQRFFVAQASHQLRNPLTALRLRVEMLELYVDEDGRDEHRHAVAELERLSDLLDSLLRLAGTEAAKAERQPVDVTAIVADRVDAWWPVYRREVTPLRVDVPPGRVVVKLLPGVIEQVLDALLHNAVKFAPGQPVDLTVTARRGSTVLSVADHGPGLPGDDLAHVGERFWRSPRHQNTDGTGLGLAIVAGLAEACGGDLRAEPTAPGGGLRVVVTLPAEVSAGPAGTTGRHRGADPVGTSR